LWRRHVNIFEIYEGRIFWYPTTYISWGENVALTHFLNFKLLHSLIF
jgi:hypothetical protein